VTRINRTDTLFTELRDIKRRLRLLEAARMRSGTAALAATSVGPTPSLLPAASAAPEASVPEVSVPEVSVPEVSVPEAPAVSAAAVIPVPLMPARPADWPGTISPDWERLAVTRAVLGERGARITLHLAADTGTVGAARVIVDGEPVGDVLPATQTTSEQTIAVPGTGAGPATGAGEPAESEIVVEARRTRGDGLVRVAALLLPA
jgi:hypothetical protein